MKVTLALDECCRYVLRTSSEWLGNSDIIEVRTH